MALATNDQLKRVIELQHGGCATFRQSVCLLTKRPRPDEWDGWVHIFDLQNNAHAQRAYAWAAPISGGTAPRYFAVLHAGQVSDPVQAVKAAASLIRSGGR